MLANHILPTQIVREFELKSKTLSIKHVHKLIEILENSNFKLTPSLSKKHVEPKQYKKMKENIAAQLLSHSTASALRYAVHDNLLPLDALTAAWFIEFVNNWFDAANARRRCEALYAKSR
jgi:SOS-response transcriptional repressor LexA